MGTLREEVAHFNKLLPELKRVANKQISKELNTLKRKLRDNSPVLSGEFERSWSVRKIRSNSVPNLITGEGVSIKNLTDYEGAIEEGVDPSSNHPWAVAVRKRGGSGSPGLRKATVQSRSRIWSRKSVGGVVRNVLTKRSQRQMADALAAKILQVFK